MSADTVGAASFFAQLPKDPYRLDIFQLKEGLVVCGEPAKRVAADFAQPNDAIRYLEDVEILPLNKNLLGQILRKYLIDEAEFEIALYEESFGTWSMRKSGSPGDLGGFEDDLVGINAVADNPVVMALATTIRHGQCSVGIALLNMATHEICINEFIDDEGFRNVECLFMQQAVSKCFVQEEIRAMDLERLKSLSKMCHVFLVKKKWTTFDTESNLLAIGDRIQSDSIESNRHVLDRPLVQTALAGLFDNVALSSTMHRIKIQDIHSFMRLDKATQQALNVFPSQTGEPANHSLYGLLNRCKTPMGKRALKTWLRQPLLDIDEIETRHNVVEAFFEDKAFRTDISSLLRGMPDLAKPLRKLENKKVTLPDLAQLYTFSRKLHPIGRRMYRYASKHQSLLQQRYLIPLERLTDEEHLRKFEKFWEVAIDTSKLPDEYLLAPRYDERLKDLSVQMDEAEKNLLAEARRICDDLGLTWDKTCKLTWYKAEKSRKRCVRMPCKEERCKRHKLQSSAKHYEVVETHKDGVKFTNKEMNIVAEELQRLTLLYESLQAALLVHVNEISVSFLEVFEDASALVTEVDILHSFALASTMAPTPYNRPALSDSKTRELVLKGGRHPMIEAQEGYHFVKNDCVMTYGESWFQLITGPNMGGKSTFIRQLGVIVLMAQIGCFVPCDSATISTRDAIFARVGAGDCQQRGVSTFLAEMLATSSIFRSASERSLVIVDELGRGTSTCDGFGLAWAISLSLITKIGCPTLFATHFHELTEMRHAVGVKNVHVHAEIDEGSKKLVMSFKVLNGPSTKSFGVRVAERAGFPPCVVHRAEAYLRKLDEYNRAPL